MLLPILLACSPRGDRVVTVESGELMHELDPRFLSFAVDSGQVAGTVFWSEDEEGYEEEVEVYDFGRPELNRLTAELSPAWLRIGGTDADRLFIDLEDELDEPPEGFRGTLGGQQLRAIGDFASQHELDLFFALNAGPSVRDEEGVWVADNADALMAWAADEAWPVGLWELGNELNGYALLHGSSVSTAQYAEDLALLGQRRDAHTPEALVAGPSSAYWPESGELGSFMEGALHAPQAEVWLGESGNAQCGGSEGVSDRFAGTFWWLDQLGTLAERGQPVVVLPARSVAFVR